MDSRCTYVVTSIMWASSPPSLFVRARSITALCRRPLRSNVNALSSARQQPMTPIIAASGFEGRFVDRTAAENAWRNRPCRAQSTTGKMLPNING